MDDQLCIFGANGFETVRPSGADLRPAPPLADQLIFATGEKSLVHDDENLYSRVVHAHSAKKAYFVRRYAEIVGTAMRHHWPGKLWWVELFAGPGRLFETESAAYLPGSPMAALAITNPFTGYVFADLDPLCVESLRTRTASFQHARVLQGDANSAQLLDEIASIVPRDALVIVYADPEGLDFHLPTVRFFTDRYPHVDWLINFPVSGAVRYLRAGHSQRAVPVLGHPNPAELLEKSTTYGPELRVYYQRQLEALGYAHFRTEPILLETKNRLLYDLMLASRHERAADLFDKACSIRPNGQRSLFVS